VRVVQIGEGGQEHLGDVVRVDIGQVLEHALIVLPDGLFRVIESLLGEDFLDDLEFQPAAPEVVSFRSGGGPDAL